MMQWGKNNAAATAKQSQNTCQYRDRPPVLRSKSLPPIFNAIPSFEGM